MTTLENVKPTLAHMGKQKSYITLAFQNVKNFVAGFAWLKKN